MMQKLRHDIRGKSWFRFQVRRILSAGLMLGLVFCFTSRSFAQVAPVLDWAVESPIQAINPVAGTMTANGMTFEIPANVVIAGTTGITGATLNRLLDASAPGRVRSIFAGPNYSGGTVIADGTTEVEAAGVRRFIAVNVFVEIAENVMLGFLDAVNPDGTLVVNGVTVIMNPDPRFPSSIVDVGFEPILDLTLLASSIGSLVTAEGYFFDPDGVGPDPGAHYGVLVETEFVPPPIDGLPTTDTVRIARAQGRNKGGNRSQIDVRGVVDPFDPNALVTISDADTGTVLGTAVQVLGAIPGQGEFTFRVRNLATVPLRVKALSDNLGEHIVDVAIR